MNVLNDREWAILLWAIVALVWALSRKDIRPSIFGIVKTFATPKIIAPLILMGGYIWLEVRLGSKLGLWNTNLTKDTIIWATTSGLVLYMSLDKASTEPKFFRGRVFAAFKIAVFIQVFVNLFVLSFPAEFILQPFLFFIAASSAVAALDPKLKLAKKFSDGLLAVIGFSVICFVTVHLISSWEVINKADLIRQLILPAWLSIGLLPFVYVFALYAMYDTSFMLIGLSTKVWRKRLRAGLALAIGLNIHIRKAGSLNLIWLRKLTKAPTLKAALKLVRRHRLTGSAS